MRHAKGKTIGSTNFMVTKNQESLGIDSPLVSIIILNYNCRKFLEKCLLSLLKTDYPDFEIIIVDNNSHDQSVEFLLQRFTQKQNRAID